MNKLATLILTMSLSLASGTALAAAGNTDVGDSNGQANAAASAGQVAPDAKQNLEPNSINNDEINTGDTNAATGNMNANEIHENTMCKDGRCPDENVSMGEHRDTDPKTDGTTQ